MDGKMVPTFVRIVLANRIIPMASIFLFWT